jgi:hypothetical protein
MNYSYLWYLLIPVLGLSIYGIKKIWPNYKDDNVVEEAVEKVIEKETGIDVDLTPASPEKKDM